MVAVGFVTRRRLIIFDVRLPSHGLGLIQATRKWDGSYVIRLTHSGYIDIKHVLTGWSFPRFSQHATKPRLKFVTKRAANLHLRQSARGRESIYLCDRPAVQVPAGAQ